MPVSTEAAIRALAASNNEIVLGGLTSIKQALEYLYYQAETLQLSAATLRGELRRVVEILEQIKATTSSSDRVKIFASQYPAFSQHVRSEYGACLPDLMLRELTVAEQRAAGLEKAILAQAYMLLAFDGNDLSDRAEKLSAGMLVLSEVLSEYETVFPPSVFAAARVAAEAILGEPFVQHQPREVEGPTANYLVALKNVARAVLWQLDRIEAVQNFPARNLAAWLASAPAWAGSPSLPVSS